MLSAGAFTLCTGEVRGFDIGRAVVVGGVASREAATELLVDPVDFLNFDLVAWGGAAGDGDWASDFPVGLLGGDRSVIRGIWVRKGSLRDEACRFVSLFHSPRRSGLRGC